MAAKRRQGFQDALAGGQPAAILAFLNAEKDPIDIPEFIQAIPRRDYDRLWSSCYSLVNHIITAGSHIVPANLDEEVAGVRETSLQIVETTVEIATAFLIHEDKANPVAFPATLKLMNDALMQFEGKLQDSILSVCESYILQKRMEWENLAATSFTLLLAKSLDGSMQKDVSRVHKLRFCLRQFSFEGQDAVYILRLLSRCIIAPQFLKSKEGQRFLSFLFELGPEVLGPVYATLKSQIPSCKKGVLDLYGEIIHRAWKEAEGASRIQIENVVLENLIESSVFARTPVLAHAVRRVLSPFFEKKDLKGVDDMLLRFYEPITYRALKYANTQVRRNAAGLLIEAFPLGLHAAISAAERDDQLQRQITFFFDLLADDFPAIREVAVEGVCRVLNQYWDHLPKEVLFDFLKKIVGDLAHDGSSAAVRAAVFKGLNFLLENPDTHATLAQVLLQLKPMINDSSEKVRIAFVQMLKRISTARTMDLESIAPMDQLLLRLAIEPPHFELNKNAAAADADNNTNEIASPSSIVSMSICELLLPTFFPHTEAPSQQLKSCIDLCKRNSVAALVFFDAVSRTRMTSIDSLLKFVSLIARAITKSMELGPEPVAVEAAASKKKKPAAKKTTKRQKKGSAANNDEDEEQAEEEAAASQPQPSAAASQSSTLRELVSNTPLLESLLEVASRITANVIDELRGHDNRNLHTYFVNAWKGTLLTELVQRFPTQRLQAAVYSLASKMPTKDMLALSQGCVPALYQLAQLDETVQQEGDETPLSICNYQAIVNCLCTWKVEQQVFDVIQACLDGSSAADSGNKQPAVANGSKKQKVTTATSKKGKQAVAAAAAAASSSSAVSAPELEGPLDVDAVTGIDLRRVRAAILLFSSLMTNPDFRHLIFDAPIGQEIADRLWTISQSIPAALESADAPSALRSDVILSIVNCLGLYSSLSSAASVKYNIADVTATPAVVARFLAICKDQILPASQSALNELAATASAVTAGEEAEEAVDMDEETPSRSRTRKSTRNRGGSKKVAASSSAAPKNATTPASSSSATMDSLPARLLVASLSWISEMAALGLIVSEEDRKNVLIATSQLIQGSGVECIHKELVTRSLKVVVHMFDIAAQSGTSTAGATDLFGTVFLQLMKWDKAARAAAKGVEAGRNTTKSSVLSCHRTAVCSVATSIARIRDSCSEVVTRLFTDANHEVMQQCQDLERRHAVAVTVAACSEASALPAMYELCSRVQAVSEVAYEHLTYHFQVAIVGMSPAADEVHATQLLLTLAAMMNSSRAQGDKAIKLHELLKKALRVMHSKLRQEAEEARAGDEWAAVIQKLDDLIAAIAARQS